MSSPGRARCAAPHDPKRPLWRLASVVMRLLNSARGRLARARVLLFLLLLAVPGACASQYFSGRLSLTPEDDLSLSPAERASSKRPCSEYRLLVGESRDCEPWVASADLTADTPLRIGQADAELPPAAEAPQPNRLLGALIPVTAVGLVVGDSLLG